MKTRLFKIYYKLHVYLGLFVAAHFVILALTGSILLFKDEIQGSAPETSIYQETHLTPGAQNFLEKALRKYPNSRPLALSREEKTPYIAQLRLGENHAKEFRGSRRVYIDLRSGEEVPPPRITSSWLDWTLRLHREFLMGSNGKLYVGFIGILYLVVLLSGLFIYGNFSKTAKFGELRRKTPRSLSADLHRYLGITTLAWGLLIGTTGIFLGFSTTLIKVFQYQELQKLVVQYPTAPKGERASLDQVLNSAHAALPQASFDYMAFPDTQFSPPGHYLILMHGNTLWDERLVQIAVIDSVTGSLTEVRALPWYLKFGLLSEPLHFGNYGGLFLKILWLIFSLASLSLPVLGVFVWYSRKKPKVKPLHPKKNLLSFQGRIYDSSWKAPAFIASLTIMGIVGSFLSAGFLNLTFTSLLLVPAFYLLKVFVKLMGERQ